VSIPPSYGGSNSSFGVGVPPTPTLAGKRRDGLGHGFPSVLSASSPYDSGPISLGCTTFGGEVLDIPILLSTRARTGTSELLALFSSDSGCLIL
jgi:hypothetical protein